MNLCNRVGAFIFTSITKISFGGFSPRVVSTLNLCVICVLLMMCMVVLIIWLFLWFVNGLSHLVDAKFE